ERVLQRDARLEGAKVGRIRDQEEIADPLEAGIAPEFLLEGFEDALALEREADLGLGSELGADAAGRLAGGAAPDGLALQHDHVADTAPGEVIGDAAADGAAADDDDTRGFRDGHALGPLATGRIIPRRGAALMTRHRGLSLRVATLQRTGGARAVEEGIVDSAGRDRVADQ